MKHKHIYEEEPIDCPFCGGGTIAYCSDCGEELPVKKFPIKKRSPKRKKIR